MRPSKLSTRLNLLFGLTLFLPMLIVTMISFVYSGLKIRDEAIRQIHSDLRAAEMIWDHAVEEMRLLADTYARKKTVTTLLLLNLGEKIGRDLAKSAMADKADMITITDTSHRVLVRSHAPGNIGDQLPRTAVTDKALSGISLCGAEMLTSGELAQEGMPGEGRTAPKAVLAMTGLAPVYDRHGKTIIGVVIVRRILNHHPGPAEKISHTLEVAAAIFGNGHLITYRNPDGEPGSPMRIPEMPASWQEKNTAWYVADIARGGSASSGLPITDIRGNPSVHIAIRRDVENYVRAREAGMLTLIALLIIGTGLGFVVRIIIGRQILRPLERLRERTRKFDPDEEAPPRVPAAPGEIGELASSFEEMAARLKVSHHTLREEVRERRQAEERIRSLHREALRLQENERQRIALDLHDDVIQELSALLLKQDVIFRGETGLSEQARMKAEECGTILRRNISALRHLAYGLRPPGLSLFGLIRTLRSLCSDFSVETGIHTDFVSEGTEAADPDDETAISVYRLVQEALNNVRKHGNATRVRVCITTDPPHTILQIDDNGQGFDTDATLGDPSREKYMGIRGMGERVRLLNGKMEIHSYPEKGTAVRIEIPTGETSDA